MDVQNSSVPLTADVDKRTVVNSLVPITSLGSEAEHAGGIAAVRGTPEPSGGFSAIFHALRRRWLAALVLGTCCGAAAAVAKWILWTSDYTTVATLRVASEQPIVMFTTRDVSTQPKFEIYKKTQRELIHSRYVLNAALRNKDVAQLPIIRQQIDPVEWTQKQINVTYPGDAEILTISMNGDDPEAITTIVNAVCDAYVDGIVHAEHNDRLARLQSLEKIRLDSEEKVRLKRAELKTLSDNFGTGDKRAATLKQEIALEDYGAMRKEQLGLEVNLMHNETKLAVIKSRLEAAKGEALDADEDSFDAYLATNAEYMAVAQAVDRRKQALHNVEDLIAKSQPSVIEKYRQDVELAEQKKQEVRSRLLPTLEPQVRKAVTRQLKADFFAASLEVDQLRAQSQRVNAEVERLGQEAHQIGRSSVDLEIMRAELENIEKIRGDLSTEIESLKIELSSAARVEVISRAEVPRYQDQAARLKAVLAFGVLGFVVPIAGLCWWDLRRKRVSTVEDIPDSLRLNLVGTLPLLPPRFHRQLSSDSQPNVWNRILLQSVDAIRELILSYGRSRPAKVIIVTSAIGGEGKTTLATQLAMSFARSTKQTLLIDFDLRRPTTHAVFGRNCEHGVAELLSNEMTLEEVVQPTSCANLYHVTAGAVDWDSAQLLCTQKSRLVDLFEQLRSQFDIIVVDSCPVLPVVDTLIIAPLADAAVLAVMRDVSENRRVLEAHDRISRIGVNVLGAVVTSKSSSVAISQYHYSSALSGQNGDAI